MNNVKLALNILGFLLKKKVGNGCGIMRRKQNIKDKMHGLIGSQSQWQNKKQRKKQYPKKKKIPLTSISHDKSQKSMYNRLKKIKNYIYF